MKTIRCEELKYKGKILDVTFGYNFSVDRWNDVEIHKCDISIEQIGFYDEDQDKVLEYKPDDQETKEVIDCFPYDSVYKDLDLEKVVEDYWQSIKDGSLGI
jgi:hypothetical protein